MLANRSNKKPEEIKAMMEKETWLDALELKNNGFVDNVISTSKKIDKMLNKDPKSMQEIYNKLINKPMSKINQMLGLKNEAEEQLQVEAIESLKNSLANKEAELTELKAELETLKTEKANKEAAEKELLKSKATELVNSLIEKGIVKESDKENTILNASKDQASFDFVSNITSKVGDGKEAVKIFNSVNVKKEETNDWTMQDWEKKDPEGLKKMYKENRTKFDELFNKSYKK